MWGGVIPILQGKMGCGTQCRGAVYPHPLSATVTYSLGEASS